MNVPEPRRPADGGPASGTDGERRLPAPGDGSSGAPAAGAPGTEPGEAPAREVADGRGPGGDGPDGGRPDGDGPDGGRPDGDGPDGGRPDGGGPGEEPTTVPTAAAPAPAARRRRDPRAAALIGVLTLLLGFALAVQVRTTDAGEVLAGAREEDLVRILDELDDRESRLRQQIAEQRSTLAQLTTSDTRSLTALEVARERAEAIGILTGTVAAQSPGLRVSIGDPRGEIRVADLIDVVQELRGAGAETMQVDGARVGVDTAVTGRPGELRVDGRPISAPYEVVVIGSPQFMETALNIPGGAVQRITGRGGTVTVTRSDSVQVDALRPLETAQYAAPATGD
ncbi:DUF881 domain-containing protein [Geodermatophilus sp. YIM 151500]|uniref:DUF881 domain-containing protein n=1 Tax=Geodermatophilus sp. YIM 151500 TaxID=2984531 RepID=UPI0021E3EF07|nr:DUF881 domain-containing protein [Geodermatophilus sp. YIM 151500]MCV2489065.1 DUF881 domain-containing protein [Geodermatophilus sp. YIM 151500]